MTSLCRSVAAALTLMLGGQALAQAPAPPAAKPLSTSLGMVVFPAKGQTAQQQQATQQQQTDLFRKGFAACLEPKGYTVK